MNQTTIIELQQELVNAKNVVTPRRIHIPTRKGAATQPLTSQPPLRFSLTPTRTGPVAGSP
eukprot:2397775-Amphidinium_carterae.1